MMDATTMATFCWVQDKLKVVLWCSGSIQLDLVLQSYWHIILPSPLNHQFALRNPLSFSKLIHFLPSNLCKCVQQSSPTHHPTINFITELTPG